MKNLLENCLWGIKHLNLEGCFLIILTIGLIISCEFESKTIEQIKQNPSETKGIITSTGMGHHPKFYYKYTVDNVIYKGHDSPIKGLRVGDSVLVIYNKHVPSKSYIFPIK